MANVLSNFSITAEEGCLIYLGVAIAYCLCWFFIFIYQLIHGSELRLFTGTYTVFQLDMVCLVYGQNCQVLWKSKINLEPIFPIFNVVTHAIGAITALVFISEFLRYSHLKTFIAKVRKFLVFLSLLAIVFSFRYPDYCIKGMYIVGLLSILVVSYSLLECLKYDRSTGTLITSAWSVMLISSTFYVLANLGVINRTFLSEHSFLFGSLCEMFVFAVAFVRLFQERSRFTESKLHNVKPTLKMLEKYHKELLENDSDEHRDRIIRKMGNAIILAKQTLIAESPSLQFKNIYAKSLVSMIENQCQEELERASVRFFVEINTPRNAQIYCIPNELTRAIVNLVFNGVYAAQASTNPWVRLTIDLEDRIRFSVMDSGGGGSLKAGRRILKTSFFAKPRGNSLGLVLAHSIAERHGGQVYMDPFSEYTRFVLEIEKV